MLNMTDWISIMGDNDKLEQAHTHTCTIRYMMSLTLKTFTYDLLW